MRKLLLTSTLFLISATISLTADFGDLAGTYSGKTAKGGQVIVSIPKSGTPTYKFRGSSVPVTAAAKSGKGVKMTVGQGGGTVTLSPAGDGKLSYRYAFNGDTASATLSKE